MCSEFVQQHWFPGESSLGLSPVAGGLSGARIWRIRLGGETQREWALRCWPEGTTPERVLEVQSVVQRVQPHCLMDNGSSLIPDLRKVVSGSRVPKNSSPINGGEVVFHQGRLWECSQWMPGEKPRVAENGICVVREIAKGIAKFHTACSTLSNAMNSQTTLAITSRLERIAWLHPKLIGISTRAERKLARLLGGVYSVDRKQFDACIESIRLLESEWSRCMQRYQSVLKHLTGMGWRQQYVLRDIHCQNTLFLSDTLRAFIDFDALRMDSPATDLARLLGSVQLELAPSQWQSQHAFLWHEALAAYREICPLSEAEEMLTRRLVEISPLLTLANWAIWIVDEPERFSGTMLDAMERMNSWARAVRMGREFTG